MAAGETTSGPAVAAAGAASNDSGGASSPDDIMDPGARMAAMLAEGVDLDNAGAAPPTASFAGDAVREDAAKPKDDAAPGADQTDATTEVAAPTQTDAVLRAGFRKLEAEKQKVLELQAEAKTAIDKAKAADDFFAELESDPAAALLGRGGEALVDKVIDAIADLSKPSAEREVAKLKRELKAKDEAAAKARAEADQAATIARWQKGIVDEVTAAGEKYDLVNSLGYQNAVIDMITQHYAATKQTMSTAQAAAKLEDFLEGNLSKSKKFGSRGTQAAATTPAAKPQPAQGSAPQKPPKQQGATTLAAIHPTEVTVEDGDIQEMDPRKRFDAVMASLGN